MTEHVEPRPASMTTVLRARRRRAAAAANVDRRAASRRPRLPDHRRRRVAREAPPLDRRRARRRAPRRRAGLHRGASGGSGRNGGPATSCTRSPIPTSWRSARPRDRIGARTYCPRRPCSSSPATSSGSREQMRAAGVTVPEAANYDSLVERDRRHRPAARDARTGLGAGPGRRGRPRVAPGAYRPPSRRVDSLVDRRARR